MSLEDKIDALNSAIAANTAATEKLTAAWAALSAQADAVRAGVESGTTTNIAAGGVVVAEVKTRKKAEKAEKTAPAPTAEPEVFEPATPAPAAPVAENDTKLAYADVAAKVLAMVKTDRAKVMSTLAKFGVENAKLLKEDQWGDFLAELTSESLA